MKPYQTAPRPPGFYGKPAFYEPEVKPSKALGGKLLYGSPFEKQMDLELL